MKNERHEKWDNAQAKAFAAYTKEPGYHTEKYKAARKTFQVELSTASREELADMVCILTLGERPPEEVAEIQAEIQAGN